MTEHMIEVQELQNEVKKKVKHAFLQLDEKKEGKVKKE